eukprot:m.316618 g.316618  ORF g.316618 m.316618 type:complete len:490 (-) comp16504_c0_seq22:1266-2735(-)
MSFAVSICKLGKCAAARHTPRKLQNLIHIHAHNRACLWQTTQVNNVKSLSVQRRNRSFFLQTNTSLCSKYKNYVQSDNQTGLNILRTYARKRNDRNEGNEAQAIGSKDRILDGNSGDVDQDEEKSLDSKNNLRFQKHVSIKNVSWQERPQLTPVEQVLVYKELTKFKLSALVVTTTVFGYAMAPAEFSAVTLFWASLGTSLCVASANTINQWAEVPYDSQMKRTKGRPLVRGAISSYHALAFGIGAGIAGSGILCTFTNHLVAGMGTVNILLYGLCYTWMKRSTASNLWVGAVVGAIPPMMGWAAAVNDINVGAVILAAVLFAWQIPHFNALSWNLRGDYARGGYRMMAVTNPRLCSLTGLIFSAALIPISFAAYATNLCTGWFLLDSTLLNLWMFFRAIQFHMNRNDGTARRLFFSSIFHLPVLLFLFLVHKRWDEEEEDSETNESQLEQEERMRKMLRTIPHLPRRTRSKQETENEHENEHEMFAKY